MATPEELAAAEKAKADAAAAEAAKNSPEALKARAEAAEKAAADARAEAAKYKGLADQTAAEKEKAKADAAKAEEERLKAGNQFKELYEKAQQQLVEADASKKRQAAAFIQTLKISEVQRAAEAAGLLPAAKADLFVVPLDNVKAVQNEDGIISIQEVDQFITKLKTDRPHWFGSGTPPRVVLPGANGQAGASGTGKISMDDLLKLQASDPEAYKKAMKENFMS